MFKLFERDKCRSLPLDTSKASRTAIVPGTLLYDDADGARVLVDDSENAGEDRITLAKAGNFYLSVDYYANANNAMISDQVDYALTGGANQLYVSSEKIAAVPLIENFDAEIMAPSNLSKGALLTIQDGGWIAAGSGDTVIAMVTEDNAATGDAVLTKITTRIAPHDIAKG